MRNGKAAKTPHGKDGFATRLRELRKQHGLSQSALGEQVEIHYTHIGRYERGLSRPAADTRKRLADALDVSGDYLLEGAVEEAEKLPDEDKDVIKRLLDAFLTKKRLQELAAR